MDRLMVCGLPRHVVFENENKNNRKNKTARQKNKLTASRMSDRKACV